MPWMKDFWARTAIEAAIDEAEARFLRKNVTLLNNGPEPRFSLSSAA
jgi:hypothetical protein